MASHSTLQAKTMSAIAHGWRPSGSASKIPVKVAKEFHAKDAGHKYGQGMHGQKGKPYPKHNKAYGGAVRIANKYKRGGYAFGGDTGQPDPSAFDPATVHRPIQDDFISNWGKRVAGPLARAPQVEDPESMRSKLLDMYNIRKMNQAIQSPQGFQAGGSTWEQGPIYDRDTPFDEAWRDTAMPAIHQFAKYGPTQIGGNKPSPFYRGMVNRAAEIRDRVGDTSPATFDARFNTRPQTDIYPADNKTILDYQEGGEVSDDVDWSRYNQPMGRLSEPHVSPTERATDIATNVLNRLGMQPYRARHMAEGVAKTMALTPLGTIGAAANLRDAMREGDYKRAATASWDLLPASKLGHALRPGAVGHRFLDTVPPAADALKEQAPQNQARGGRFQMGGGYKPPRSNFNPERASSFGLSKQGMIHSDVPGRTDKLNLNVPSGSYIIPADVTSGMGQGNSMAGGEILNRMFNKGPYGMNITKMKGGSPRMGGMRMSSLSKMSGPGGSGSFGKSTMGGPGGFAPGGVPDTGQDAAPIVAAGGEYVVHPDSVARLGGGDIDTGHDILDRFVELQRKKHIKDLKGLKPPKGSDAAKGKAYGGRLRYADGGDVIPFRPNVPDDPAALEANRINRLRSYTTPDDPTNVSAFPEKYVPPAEPAQRVPLTPPATDPTYTARQNDAFNELSNFVDRMNNKYEDVSQWSDFEKRQYQQLKRANNTVPRTVDRFTPARPVYGTGSVLPFARPKHSLQSAGAPLGPETFQYRGGRTAYARGGGLKLSKQSVQYTNHGHKDAKCGICKHFRDGHCAIVSGPIAAGGWCNRFARK